MERDDGDGVGHAAAAPSSSSSSGGDEVSANERRAVWAAVAETLGDADRHEEAVELVVRWASLLASTTSGGLTDKERASFSGIFRGCIGSTRVSYRSILSLHHRQEARGGASPSHEMKMRLLDTFLNQIAEEARGICRLAIDVIDRFLFPFCEANSDKEGAVFCLNKKSEYLRYLVDVERDQDRVRALQVALNATTTAMHFSKVKLPPTHLMRLGQALHLSALLAHEANEVRAACQVAREAIEDVEAYVGGREALTAQSEFRDAVLVVRLLEDNLAQWEPQLDGLDTRPTPSL